MFELNPNFSAKSIPHKKLKKELTHEGYYDATGNIVPMEDISSRYKEAFEQAKQVGQRLRITAIGSNSIGGNIMNYCFLFQLDPDDSEEENWILQGNLPRGFSKNISKEQNSMGDMVYRFDMHDMEVFLYYLNKGNLQSLQVKSVSVE